MVGGAALDATLRTPGGVAAETGLPLATTSEEIRFADRLRAEQMQAVLEGYQTRYGVVR